jgi:hypothetical protein
MKTWAKVGIGCLVALLAACIVMAGLFIFAGSWVKHQINRFSGGAADMASNVKAIEQLDKSYPFTAPENGEVDEARLRAYIAVTGRIKQAMNPYADWIKQHQHKSGETGDWSDVKKAMTMTAALTAAMKKGLEEEHMGSAEYHWIENAMREASSEPPASGGGDQAQRKMIQDSIEVLEAQMSAPGLSESDREALQGQVDKLKGQMAELGGDQQVSHNRALYEKYEAQLKANDLREFEGLNIH